LVHGFGESSDGWLESAYIYALNGMQVHAIDQETYGFSGGVRLTGPRIDSQHFSLTALIQRFEDGIPAFLYGNSFGCMVINTFLLRNPDLKLAGVIFSAPFFGLSENVRLTWFKKQFLLFAAPFMEVSQQ